MKLPELILFWINVCKAPVIPLIASNTPDVNPPWKSKVFKFKLITFWVTLTVVGGDSESVLGDWKRKVKATLEELRVEAVAVPPPEEGISSSLALQLYPAL